MFLKCIHSFRVMYWPSFKRNASSIWKSGMDGSSPSKLVAGLFNPYGIVIDFQMSKLFWADADTSKIQSSNLDGSDVRTIIRHVAWPHGMVFVGNRLYWGTSGMNQMQSSTKKGTDIRTHYTDTDDIKYVTVVPDIERPTNRPNHCLGQQCSGICVLTTNSYKCLN